MKRQTIASFLLTAGCLGQLTDGLYLGEPLAEVSGYVTADRALEVQHPVRLAIAWYSPGLGLEASAPALATQELPFTSTFPARYTFGLFGPPPPAVQTRIQPDGGDARWAVGVLLAYEDINENGVLDPLQREGTSAASTARSPDRLLGTSAGERYDETAPRHFIYYVAGDAATADHGTSSWRGQLQRGFTLVREDGETMEPLPLDETPVPLHLSGRAELAVWLCDDAPRLYQFGPLPCGLPRTAGNLWFLCTLAALSEEDRVHCSLYSGDSPARGSSLEVNGLRIPESLEVEGHPLFVHSSPPDALLRPGARNRVVAVAAGGQEVSLWAELPGPFEILSPREGEPALSGAATGPTVSWTASAGALGYFVALYAGESSEPLASSGPMALGPAETTFVFPPLLGVDDARLEVLALGASTGSWSSGFLNTVGVRTRRTSVARE